MDRAAFQEQLLQVMEQKSHWAWPLFCAGKVPADLLHIHLEQEFATYIRDFPVLVGWAYVKCPISAVRRELIENVYEEETGGLVAGGPHPELFLELPRGLGMDLERFDQIALLPGSQRYRALLDAITQQRHWTHAAAVTTLFVEGTRYERGELDSSAPKRPLPELSEHPLVRHYGLDPARLVLSKAHREVEGDHRAAAWRVMLNHVPDTERVGVTRSMQQALDAWLAYRDDVAASCGLTRAMLTESAP